MNNLPFEKMMINEQVGTDSQKHPEQTRGSAHPPASSLPPFFDLPSVSWIPGPSRVTRGPRLLCCGLLWPLEFHGPRKQFVRTERGCRTGSKKIPCGTARQCQFWVQDGRQVVQSWPMDVRLHHMESFLKPNTTFRCSAPTCTEFVIPPCCMINCWNVAH